MTPDPWRVGGRAELKSLVKSMLPRHGNPRIKEEEGYVSPIPRPRGVIGSRVAVTRCPPSSAKPLVSPEDEGSACDRNMLTLRHFMANLLRGPASEE
ncbi:hypothetical protein PG987_005782 [Apiospora arundinis]